MLKPPKRLTPEATAADFTKLPWGQAYEVAKPTGTYLHCAAPLPADASPFWLVYNAHREAMAADGLVFQKPTDGAWRVLFKIKVTPAIYKPPKAGGKYPKWMVKLRSAAKKYSKG